MLGRRVEAGRRQLDTRARCAFLASSPKAMLSLPMMTWPLAKRMLRLGHVPSSAAAKSTSRSLIAAAASCAAMPLRSEPEEAAVGEVFGTLPVVVAVIFTRSRLDAEFLGHHLRHLDIEPLPHLGAAVIEMHRAVGIDMDQRAGLVQVGEGEGDAELHRRQRQALLQESVLAR